MDKLFEVVLFMFISFMLVVGCFGVVYDVFVAPPFQQECYKQFKTFEYKRISGKLYCQTAPNHWQAAKEVR